MLEVTFQLGHCTGDRPSCFHFSLSGSAVWALELPASLPHAGPSPSRGHRREVTFQSVPVNENLLSASYEPSRRLLLGGVGTDNSGAVQSSPLHACQNARRGPFNLASAASPLHQPRAPQDHTTRPPCSAPMSAQAAPCLGFSRRLQSPPGSLRPAPLPFPSSCLEHVPKCRGEATVGPGEVKVASGERDWGGQPWREGGCRLWGGVQESAREEMGLNSRLCGPQRDLEIYGGDLLEGDRGEGTHSWPHL